MKCPMCNGSGKCYEQKIRYQEIETNRTDFTLAKCHKCNGTGEVQMTNEEWFATLSTEEKAKVLIDLYWDFNYKERLYYNFETTEKSYERWLKQPHKDTK